MTALILFMYLIMSLPIIASACVVVIRSIRPRKAPPPPLGARDLQTAIMRKPLCTWYEISD